MNERDEQDPVWDDNVERLVGRYDPERPSDEFRARVTERMAAHAAGGRAIRRPAWRRWLPVAAAAALVGLGVWLVTANRDADPKQREVGRVAAPFGGDQGDEASKLAADPAAPDSTAEVDTILRELGRLQAHRERLGDDPADSAFNGQPAPNVELHDNRAAPGSPSYVRDFDVQVAQGASVDGASVEGKLAPTKIAVRTWKRSSVTPNSTRLMVGDKEDLKLEALQVRARVDGHRARVLLDCYFYNDRDQQLEGTFKLRLPDGASPYYLAFGQCAIEAPTAIGDVLYDAAVARKMSDAPDEILAERKERWSEAKEARIVPKEKAAYAYTDTVRRSVDPALMEWSGAGVFSARIFPIAPHKVHHVVIGYDVDLLQVGQDLLYRLDLPEGEMRRTVDLQIAKVASLTIATEPELDGDVAGDLVCYRLDSEQLVGVRSLEARLTLPGPMLLAGSDERLGAFFTTRFTPKVRAEKRDITPRPAVLLVDTSLSANPDHFGAQLKLLDAILGENEQEIPRFAVLFFNVESFWWQAGWTANTKSTRADLQSFCGRLALEGATDLGAALREAVSPAWIEETKPIPYPLFLLGDGAPTWGERDLYALSLTLTSSLRGPLFAYRTGLAGTSVATLEHLARESGGAVFRVVGEDEIAAAAVAHRQRPWRIRGVAVEGGSDVLLAGRPTTYFPGQALVVAGRGEPADDASIVVELERDGRVTQARAMVHGRVVSAAAARAYGQVAVGQLEALGDATEEYSKAYATRFRVVGQTCSLLMLESEADYERYGIKPEEDAHVIRSSKAAEVVARTLREVGQSLGDAKAWFTGRLAKLGEIPGVEFAVPKALALVVEQLPREAFAVPSARLRCQERTWQGVPGAIQEQLAGKKLDYDALVAEAERRRAALGAADAIKALSSLIENSAGDVVLARDVAFSALAWGEAATAYHLLRGVAERRPYEPQTYLSLALVLEQLGKTDLALLWYEVALTGQWPARFGEFRKIAAVEYLRFLRASEPTVADYAKDRLATLAAEIGMERADLLVTIQWNTDRTDVDLHVIEPSGEECFYSHPKTKIGGSITADVTQGYGPEMYLLPNGVHGDFRVRARYYSGDRNRASARSKVFATIYEGWGTKAQKVTRKTVTLVEGKEMLDLLTVRVEK